MITIVKILALLQAMRSTASDNSNSILKGTYSVKWKFQSNVPVASSLVQSNANNHSFGSQVDYLYFMTKSGFLLAVGKGRGKVLWSKETLSAVDIDLTASRPAIISYDVPVQLSSINSSNVTNDLKSSSLQYSHPITQAIVIGGVQAFDSKTGDLIWVSKFASTLGNNPVLARINNTQSVIIGSRVAVLFALRATNGEVLWKSLLSGGSTTTPTLLNKRGSDETEIIYVGTTAAPNHGNKRNLGFVYAINATNGEIIWRFSPHLLSSFLSPISLHFSGSSLSSVIVSTSGLDDKNVAFALNPIDGSVRWKIALAMQMKNTVATSVVSMNTKTVAFSGNDGTLLGVDVVTGVLRWQFICDGGILGDPLLVTLKSSPSSLLDIIFVNSLDGNLYVLDFSTGVVVTKYSADSPLIFGPSSTLALSPGGSSMNDTIYIGSKKGEIHSILFSFSLTSSNETRAITSPSPSVPPTIVPIVTSPVIAPSNSPISFESALSPVPSASPTSAGQIYSKATMNSKGAMMLDNPLYLALLILLCVTVCSYVTLNARRGTAAKYSKVYTTDEECNSDDMGSSLHGTPKSNRFKPRRGANFGRFMRGDSRVHVAQSEPDNFEEEIGMDVRKKPGAESSLTPEGHWTASKRKDRDRVSRVEPDQDIYQTEAIRASIGPSPIRAGSSSSILNSPLLRNSSSSLFKPIPIKASID